MNQYPDGTDLLWLAMYRDEPDSGNCEGPSLKLSGTAEEAMALAQRWAVQEQLILQCLKRRY